MFNKSKFLVAGVLGVALALTGCGNSEKVDAKELLKSASSKLSEAKSYEMDMELVLAMEVKDQGTMDMNVAMDTKMIVNPEIAAQMDTTIDMKVDGEGQSLTTEQYIVKEDNQYNVYTNAMDTWSKMSAGNAEEVESLMQDPTTDIDEYLATIDDITISGEEKIDGIDCYAIKVNITKEYFDSVLDDMDLLSNVGLDAETLAQTTETLENVESLPVYYYVGKESGNIVGMNMDMSDLMKSAFIATGATTEEALTNIKVITSLTITNIDGVSEITLPEEAASAIQM